MCRGYSAECAVKGCKVLADCRFDPFCKAHRAYFYDNPGAEGYGRPKYEPGRTGEFDGLDP